MSEDNSHSYLLHQVRETGVHLICLWFADVAGRLREVSITVEQLAAVLEDGLGVDGGVMEGPSQDESELILVPDPSTYAMLPRPEGRSDVARMFCDVRLPDGRPAPDDTRAVLKRGLDRAAEMGFTFYVGCEIEHFLLVSDEPPLTPVDRGGRYEPGRAQHLLGLTRETMTALERLGVAVDSVHHEDAPAQYKVGIQYSDALSLADGVVTYRQVVRQMARRHGVHASFMPKPFTRYEGSGLHFSLSLAQEEQNVFYDADSDLGLSDLARSFAAGLLQHAPTITLVTNPTVNSYKRLAPGFAAPTFCSWATAGRGDLLRVPTLQAGHGSSTRLEYRAPDPSCNPYLALAAILAAGLDGVERGATPPAPRAPDASPGDVGAPLPRHLPEALELAGQSELLQEALGDALLEELQRTARKAWDSYHSHVTRWEIERLL